LSGEGHVARQCKEPKLILMWMMDQMLPLHSWQIFLLQELHQEEGIESLLEENTIPYSEHMASNDEHPSGSYLQFLPQLSLT
nr:hypothetical protein [Tanacetum cinerariifolium]